MKTVTGWLIAVPGIAGLIVLPLAGAWMTGRPISQYTEFPPLTRYVEHAGFSLPVFIIFSLGALALFIPMLRALRRAWKTRPARPPSARFPAWGWVGVAWTAAAWVLAWTRFEWAAPLQPFTFTPLWLGYIVVVNALAYRRRGACMMTGQRLYFLVLFPVSAAFWWYFEYLNRFVQNWYYVGVTGITPAQYVWMATLPFSTVLPAVLGTYDWLDASLGPLPGAEARLPVVAGRVREKFLAVPLLAASALGLALLAARPDVLFPLLWISPLFILSALRLLGGRPPLDVEPGNSLARRAALLAAAGLICGVFWEMWNMYSLARWIYAVPYVNRFHVFEVPLLGFAGYLPFGLECALVGDAVRCRLARREGGGA